MRLGVVADLVALLGHRSYQVRKPNGIRADNEKCRLCAELAQYVKHLRGEKGTGTVVKSQCNVFMTCCNRVKYQAIAATLPVVTTSRWGFFGGGQ